VDADDVITKEEQIFLLLKAKAKCERHLKAKVPKVHGECSHSNPRLHGWGWAPLYSTPALPFSPIHRAWSMQGRQLKKTRQTVFSG